MPSLTIKDLPAPVHHRLKERAAMHHRSLNQEVIACLERAVGAERFDAEQWLRDAEALRTELGLKPLSERELRAARSAGRS